MKSHPPVICDNCGDPVPEERLKRYARNPNHHCVHQNYDGLNQEHFCSDECYRTFGDNGAGL